jgi:hypothetical protein
MWADVVLVLLVEVVVAVYVPVEHAASLPQSVEIGEVVVAVYFAV